MDIKLIPQKKKTVEESSVGRRVPMTGFSQMRGRAPQGSVLMKISIGLLGIVVLVWLGFWGYQASLIKERNNLDQRIENLQNQRDLDLEDKFANLEKGIENLKNILKTRIYPSYLFVMLEELTLPQVQFIELDTDLSQAKIYLQTTAVDYKTLAKQLVVFKEDWRVKKAVLSEIKLSDFGGVSSSLEIELNPSFLHP